MHPELLTPVLQIIHRVINTFLIRQVGVKRREAASGAITLIQRFGSAANLNIHLHGLVLDGVYCASGESASVFHQALAPTHQQLQTLIYKIIKRIMKLLTNLGYLTDEEGITYMARTDDIDPDNALTPLQAASSTYRIALGPRAGRKVLSLHYAPRGAAHPTTVRQCPRLQPACRGAL